MNKFRNVILGIFFWISFFLNLFLQISHMSYFPPKIQFFFIGFITLFTIINQTILFSKIYFDIKYLKNKVSFIYYIFSIINLCFILFCLFYLTVLFLLY